MSHISCLGENAKQGKSAVVLHCHIKQRQNIETIYWMCLQVDCLVAHTRCLLTPRAMTLSLQVSYGMCQPISASCQRPLAQSGPDLNQAAQAVNKLKLDYCCDVHRHD